MGLFDWAFKSNDEISNSEIPNIFPFSLDKDTFVANDVFQTYLKILTDTVERTSGLNADIETVLWDNCLQNEAPDGLISLLAWAMSHKKDLFIVYKPSTKVIRHADTKEEQQIRDDYKANGESNVGVFLSFRKYQRTDMLLIYSQLEYCVLGALNKSLNLSKAIQIKISDLRQSVALTDAGIAQSQARSIAKALGRGNDTFMDVKDMVETAKVDTEPAEKAISFLDSKRAFILGLPLCYVAGETGYGLSDTGKGDARAVERGLRQYYVSIIRPVMNTLFGIETEFQSEDFEMLSSSLETLKTFDLVSEEYLSSETKQKFIARLFGVNAEEEAALIEEDAQEAAANPEPTPIVVQQVPTAANQNQNDQTYNQNQQKGKA